MATANDYLASVNSVQGDIGTLNGYSGNIGTALDGAEFVLNLPGDIEASLRSKASAIDLPNSIVTVLGALPFGIGTAIKQLDNIANSVSGTVDAQADVMAALDGSWAPARTVVDTVQTANTTLANALTGLLTELSIRQDEAVILADSLGAQDIYVGSGLATRLDAYTAAVGAWQTSRDALLAPLDAALSGLDAARIALDAAVPDLSALNSALNSALSVFNGAASIANTIKNAIDVTLDLPWPLPDINVLDVLETITSWIGAVVDIVEDFVIDLFASIGIDINSVFDAVASQMLGFLTPFFDAFASLQASATALLAPVTAAVDDINAAFDAIVAEITDFVDTGSLFANTIIGDEAPNLVNFADTLTGTAGEDGIYGLQGDDTLNGASGDDFLFGGAEDDTLLGGAGNDESYGGDGADFVIGGNGADLADGGAGQDILLTGAGSDIVIGGADTDLLLGGTQADTFVFGFGDGVDLLLDFENDIDTIEIDSALLAPGTTVDQVVANNAIDIGSHVLLNFGADKILVLNLDSKLSLLDDLTIA